MKKILFVLSFGCLLVKSPQICFAQPPDPTFTFEYDTLYVTSSGEFSIANGVLVSEQVQNVSLEWKVVNTDFPQGWFSWMGICDNNFCYAELSPWYNVLHTTVPYVYAANNNSYDGFSLGGGFDAGSTTGTYYLTVEATDVNSISNVQTHTYIVTNPQQGNRPARTELDRGGAISMYPNPVTEELNINFETQSDVKTIEIFNALGQRTYSSSVRSNRPRINARDFSAGTYFIQFKNRFGKTISTNKFEKI